MPDILLGTEKVVSAGGVKVKCSEMQGECPVFDHCDSM